MAVYKRGRPAKYDPTTKSGKKPPKEPGEYRIRDDSGKIIYIGETNNLERRMREHIRSGKLKTFRVEKQIRISREALIEYIKQEQQRHDT